MARVELLRLGLRTMGSLGLTLFLAPQPQTVGDLALLPIALEVMEDLAAAQLAPTVVNPAAGQAPLDKVLMGAAQGDKALRVEVAVAVVKEVLDLLVPLTV